MKIGFYVPSWPPGLQSNGIVTYASQLVPALRRLGNEVFVVTGCRLDSRQDPYTIALDDFKGSPTFLNRVMFKLAPGTTHFDTTATRIALAVRYLVEKHSLDVFEMEETGGWNYRVSQLGMLPVVVRLHGPWFLTGRYNAPNDNVRTNRGRRQREERGIRHAQLVTSPSAKVLQAVRQAYDIGLANSRVIANPVEPTAEGEGWNSDSCNKDSVLYVGRFDERKGGDLILRVFVQLATSFPKLTLTFVGDDVGIKDLSGETRFFEDFVRKNIPEPYQPRIRFCGQIDRSSVMSLRLRHALTVVASQYEILPYSVLEAMALGSPLVATDVGGIPELIDDQRNGILVPSQDLNAMVAACKRLIDHPNLSARIGRQAWEDCVKLYAPDVIAKQTVAAYEEAVARFKG